MARPSRRPGNLPAETTSFVGRRRELAEIRRKLAVTRLVTLVGPGGVGKTRLAHRAATELARGFAGGGWAVELLDVRDPALVGSAFAAALDLRDQTATPPLGLVLDFVKDRQLLLVVDNCEHVLPAAAAMVSELIRTAPGVRVIATSREPLAVAGEQVVPVPPLELPSPHADEPLAQLRQNEAVMLFIERAAAASGAFELTAGNRSAVADVCRRLDGLPLAIELAAVRTRVLGIGQILQKLDDRFALLVGGGRAALPRHQTLRTTIDWSYDLLTPEEQSALRHLCVFAGRFVLEDAESVFAPSRRAEENLDLISSLVDKSLVVKEDVRSQACYRLHESMREYAGLKLREAAEREDVERRSAEHFRGRGLLQVAEARYRLAEWLEWMELEVDNIRSAMRWFIDRGEHSAGMDLAVSAGWYWVTRATTEGVRWLDELLRSAGGDEPMLPWACFMRGFLAVLQSDPAAAQPVLMRGLAVARERDQADVILDLLCMSSIAASMAGDRAAATRFLQEAESAVRRAETPWAPLSVVQTRVMHGFFAGEVEEVRRAAEEGIRLSRESSDLYALEMMSLNLGFVDLISGDLSGAKPRFAEALRIAQEIDDRVAQYALLYALAFVAVSAAQARLAAQLLGGAEAVRTGAGAAVIAILNPIIEQTREAAATALGRTRFESEVEAGRRLGRPAAIELALGETAQTQAAATDSAATAPLARREADVARLVAEGLSNKEIGARLFISERTVDSHVRSILNKLGFNSRAQIAAWMATVRS